MVSVEKQNLQRILIVLTAGLIGGALFYMIAIPRPIQVDAATTVRGNFRQTLDLDGILRSKERFTVPAFADGDIKRIGLKVGDSVTKNQTIGELLWDVSYQPIKAPIDGVVSKVYRESAGPIRRGEPIVEIIDPARLEVMAEPLTTDAMRLRVGGTITLNNLGGTAPLAGKITRISKAGFIKQSALGVEEERTEVTADLDHLPSDLLSRVGSSFHVDISFEVSELAGVLKVPVGAIFRDGPNWAVYVLDKGQARKRTVGVTAVNTSEAVIENGLTAGERVVVYPGDLVKDGVRVKANP